MSAAICVGVKVRPASRANPAQNPAPSTMAEVVGVAVAPIEALEGGGVEAGELDEAEVRGGFLGAEDLAVVEDDGADGHQRQGSVKQRVAGSG